MKILIIKMFLLGLMNIVTTVYVQAQAPQGINFQAVARDGSGHLLKNQSISVKTIVREGSVNGATSYEETHQITTDVFGLFNLVIGNGNPLTGTFKDIDWGSNSKFLQVSIDPEGGTNFIDIATTQLLSVPYALFAETSGDKTWVKEDSLIFYDKGNVGIGIEEPEALLHINRLVPQDDTFIEPMFRLSQTDTSATGMGGSNSVGINIGLTQNQAYITSNQQGAFSIGSDAKEQSALIFNTGGEERMFIDANGRVGIGTTTPGALLQIHDPSSSDVSFTQYTNTLTSTGNGRGMFVGVNGIVGLVSYEQSGSLLNLRGNSITLSSRSEIHLESSSSFQNQLIIKTSRTGIRTEDPTHELHVVHTSTSGGGATAGLKIENEGSNHNWWALYTANGSGQLELYYKGTIKGKFSPADGAYQQGSDRRLKRNIESLSDVLEKVLLLNPSTYYYKDVQNPEAPSIGFIAQDVQPLFPELVSYAGEKQDIMTLNYNGFSVLAIKAIQEQQTLIEELQKRIETLEKAQNIEK